MSSGRTAQCEPESAFEHSAFEHLYARVLHDVADHRLDTLQRNAAARALAFLLRERLADEAVATDVLTATHRSLDLSKVVRTLLLGLRDALGPYEKITEWTRDVANRALAEGHVPSFLTALRILVGLRDYDGRVPTQWRIALLTAIETVELARRVLHFAKAYTSRFPDNSLWLRTLRRHSAIAVLHRSPGLVEVRR